MAVRTLSAQKMTANIYNKRNAKLSSGSTVFDGAGDYLTIADHSALELGSSNFTIEMWIKTAQTAAYSTIYARDTANNGSGDFILLMNTGSANGLLAIYSSNLSLSGFQTSGVSIIDNAWHHIALVRNGGNLNIYVDGVSRLATSTGGTLADISGSWYVGYDQSFGRDFAGSISNLRVVKSAVYTSGFTVPTSQLTAISSTSLLTCQNLTGPILDASPNALTITAVGQAQAQTSNPFT
jgi:hypothetical protein